MKLGEVSLKIKLLRGAFSDPKASPKETVSSPRNHILIQIQMWILLDPDTQNMHAIISLICGTQSQTATFVLFLSINVYFTYSLIFTGSDHTFYK